jgi:hypothetical protein
MKSLSGNRIRREDLWRIEQLESTAVTRVRPEPPLESGGGHSQMGFQCGMRNGRGGGYKDAAQSRTSIAVKKVSFVTLTGDEKSSMTRSLVANVG